MTLERDLKHRKRSMRKKGREKSVRKFSYQMIVTVCIEWNLIDKLGDVRPKTKGCEVTLTTEFPVDIRESTI